MEHLGVRIGGRLRDPPHVPSPDRGSTEGTPPASRVTIPRPNGDPMSKALPLAALILTACVSVHSTPLASTPYPSVPADSVRLFVLNAPAKYTELAMMRVDHFLTSDKKSVRALKEKAGAMGANGVILLNPRAAVLGNSGPNVGVIVGGKHPSSVIFGDSDNDDIDEFKRAVAIRYVPEAAGTSDSTRTATTP